MRGGSVFLGLILIIVLTALASASYTLGNASSNIASKYAPGENITGWINLSFSNQPADSIISTSLGENISLYDLFNRSGSSYECNPSNCGNNYQTTDGEDSKTISLSGGESKTLGFLVQGDVSGIDSLSFEVNSSADESCDSPLKIDLFADNKIDWADKKPTGNFGCSEDYGCYDLNSEPTEYNLAEKPYCEKVTLSQSPQFQIGAWVKKGDVWTDGMIKMQIYTLSNQLKAECNLPMPDNGGEVSCTTNFSTDSQGDYYVCIKGQAGMNNYKVLGEGSSPCGFYDSYKNGYTNDYYIFARGGIYDNVGEFEYNNSVFSQFSSNSLSSYMNNYISSKYNNDCSNGCSIPFVFMAGESQNIEISNVSLLYTKTQGSVSSNSIYDISLTPANINSAFSAITLESLGFKAPSEYGNSTFKIFINNVEVAEKEIEVIKKPIINSVSPESTAAAVPTRFYADVVSLDNKSITKYTWDFGDGSSLETTSNYSQHTYNDTGLYSLKISVVDSAGLSAEKTVTISVGNPKDLINGSLAEKNKWLENLSSQLNLMDTWEAGVIKDKINITNIQSGLRSLSQEYLSATSEESYVSIMTRLNELNIPSAVERSNIASIPFVQTFKEISPDKLKFLGAGNFDEGSYDEVIKNWFGENMNGDVASKSIVFDYADRKEVILTFFSLNLSEKTNVGEIYLVVNGESVFKDTSVDLTDAVGMKISGNKLVDFAKEGLVLLTDLQAYVSPKFSAMPSISQTGCNSNGVCESDRGEDKNNCSSDCKSSGWKVFWIIFIIIIIIAVGGYLFLRWKGAKKGGEDGGKKKVFPGFPPRETVRQEVQKNEPKPDINNQNSTGFKSAFKPFRSE